MVLGDHRYRGVNRVSPRGIKAPVTLIRTLRSYVESHLSDLVNMNDFAPVVIEGVSPYGSDDAVEATLEINGQRFTLHIESSDADDLAKPNGALGVIHEETSMAVSGPLDASTWARVEALVRLASKPQADDGCAE
jgi:hypothetical protein